MSFINKVDHHSPNKVTKKAKKVAQAMKCATQTTDGRRTHRGKDRTTYTQRGRQSEGYSNMKASL